MKKQLRESNLASFYIYIYLQVLGRNKLTVSAITQGGSDLAFSALAFPSLSMVRQWFWAPYQSGLSVPGRYSPSSSFAKYFSLSSGVVWGNSWKGVNIFSLVLLYSMWPPHQFILFWKYVDNILCCWFGVGVVDCIAATELRCGCDGVVGVALLGCEVVACWLRLVIATLESSSSSCVVVGFIGLLMEALLKVC